MRECLARPVPPASLDSPGHLDSLDSLAHPDHLDSPDSLGHPDSPGHPDSLDPQCHPANAKTLQAHPCKRLSSKRRSTGKGLKRSWLAFASNSSSKLKGLRLPKR